ncbi:MAG: 50S ribosomal protein L18 [Candidatus Cloacimonetes bacterium]|nr:50S ribosomal protein L18 [Candidatus Cloacimonadota bacterium]
MKFKNISYLKKLARTRRHLHIRNRVFGTEQRPRLVVFRSLMNIYAQIIDDQKGHTLVAMSSISKDLELDKAAKKTEVSFIVGQKLGEMAIAKGITKVSFDRGGYLYHGRVKALADGARKAGLEF